MDLFHLQDEAQGSVFWHPKGYMVWRQLEGYLRRRLDADGYVEVKTPQIYDSSLWKTSGHWQKYRHEMFKIPLDDGRVFALKPMNCPGHMLLFGSELRSYRDLPIRFAESSVLHRNELAGVLHGLIRARLFSQDDAHIFCTHEQIQGEIDAILDSVVHLYGLFGLDARAELSTRPENHLGAAEDWDVAEEALRAALDRNGMTYAVSEGEGAFYGPKIDLHMEDSLGRSWQMGTIQLDFQMPARFGLKYVGSDNHEHVPVVIHRAILGALERFLGIYIEHVGGEFPLWLAPVQVAVVPVGEAHDEPARELVGWFRRQEVRAELMPATETVGKRVRAAELQKIPYVVVWGDRESNEALSVRDRSGAQSVVSASELAERATSAAEAALGSSLAPELASGVRA
jgi:threonyl-tRNA synthetase